MKSLYPLKFTPILKDKIWGGKKLKTVLNKESDLPNVGESWEISDVEGDTSVVSIGNLEGESLTQLLKKFKASLVGEKNYKQFGNKFPLLIKFIDAAKDLSVQLHPNDALAKERHNSFGKTEMWYVMQADENAKLIVDFNQKVDSKTYLNHLENKTLTNILNFEEVKEGDAYFIEVGRIHAIGAGVMVAEIQQTSDITYRVYDWDRVDNNGNERELHNDLAIDAIGFDMPNNFKLDYSREVNNSNLVKSCQYFTTNYISLHDFELNKANTFDSFIIYMCLEGTFSVIFNGEETKVQKGETILIPAEIKTFKIRSQSANLLEVYV